MLNAQFKTESDTYTSIETATSGYYKAVKEEDEGGCEYHVSSTVMGRSIGRSLFILVSVFYQRRKQDTAYPSVRETGLQIFLS